MRRFLALLLTAALAPSLHAQTAPPQKMRIGMNVNWINMYQTGAPHNDAMVAAGPDWHPAWNMAGPNNAVLYAPSGSPPPVGYHTNAATGGYARPGIYTLKASGKGSLQVRFLGAGGAKVIAGTLPASGMATFTGAEIYTFTIPPANPTTTVNLTVAASDSTAPLDRIQLLTPGSGPGLYHPEYVAALRPFDVIRVMDPQFTSGSQEVRWADRITRPGEDLESLIALANAAHRDLWVCVPARAVAANGMPTDYAYQLGDLLNSCLDPGLKVYVEYSNEVWNWGNPWIDETNYVFSQGAIDYNDESGRRWYAKAAYRVHQAIASRLGPCGPKLVRVFAGQLANVGTIDPCLPWAVGKGYRFDCLAGGMYWGLNADANAIRAAWTSGDQAGALKLVDDGFRAGEATMMGWVKTYAAYAKKYGMDLVAYEGGVGGGLWSDPVGNQVMRAYVASPLCVQQHMDTYRDLDAAGVALFNHYSYSHVDPTTSARLHAGDHTNGQYRSLLRWVQGAPPARFLGPDATTKGDWVGTYGALGAAVAGGPAPAQPPGPPGIASVTPLPSPARLFVQAATTTDARAPQLPDGSGRVAAWWYSPTGIDLDVPADPAGAVRILSLYFLEWQSSWNDSFTASVIDADSGTVLDSRPVASYDAGVPTSFGTGVYLRWAIEGHVTVRLKQSSGNAKFSGIFLDPAPTP